MALRIEISSTISDPRGAAKRRFFNSLGLGTKVKNVQIADAYTVDKNLNTAQARKTAELLTNPLTERSSARPDEERFDYAVEIGFLPGVTDNVGATAKKTIAEGAHLQFKNSERVYSSQIFYLTFAPPRGKKQSPAGEADTRAIANALHNPLIQKATIKSFAQFQADNGFAPNLPVVALTQQRTAVTIDLNVPDEELTAIGKWGILDPAAGTRRGPLALNLDQLKAVRTYFHKQNRKPTDVELESLAQTWSEHCKHTIFADPLDDIADGLYRHYIKAATKIIRERLARQKNDFCVSVFSDNSGAIVFDKNYLVTHKVETHNTPSALDPFGGAITGIVGVNRDCLGFGLAAKPIINTYGFCVAPPDDKTLLYRDEEKKQPMLSARRIFSGVIAGINAGGNQSGIPTNDGFVCFDERFRGKPLVFAGTVGLIPRAIKRRPAHVKYSKTGDLIVMAGGRVGLDGIHGATFSSESLSKDSPATAVQIGDPITQKKLSDALIREARDRELFSSISDCGAGGLSSAVGEMALATGGCEVRLNDVPLKYPGLSPWQIWISESQERMVLAVPKSRWKPFAAVMEKHGVEATVIGTFTDSGRCKATYRNETVMDIDMDFLHNGRPIQYQVSSPPKTSLQPEVPEQNQRQPLNLKSLILHLLQQPNIASYAFISAQYDHEVQGGSVTKPLQGKGRVNSDASVTKPILTSNKGVVLAHALYPSYGDADTYRMAAAAIDSAVRAAICAGAPLNHLAILDNFCWYSGNEPESLHKLKAAAKACFDVACAYGTPFISGKDSMYNDFKGFDEDGQAIKISIPPTLLISAIGVMIDAGKAVTLDVKLPGDFLYVLGETNSESSVPQVRTEKNLNLYRVLQDAIADELVASAISISHGGLAAALCKTLIAGQLSADINIAKLPGTWTTDFEAFCSESQGRALVSIAPAKAARFEKQMKNIAFAKIGETNGGTLVAIKNGETNIARLSLGEITDAYRAPFKNW
ncbi:hypothetical protein A2242_03355 [Candidatus Falkowbacteria bacterium RIFOXYA2_FULL_47_9]|uniref:Phosphoribosylformylglycinamidine synthase subunit PurL n=1 Tax=Candidatus Falkowbacteria bacterium RIFOXYA2_FULL_47_9 TaxID=1797995 RepID=A0A1F5SKV2_9BACT|nr:MAG: hypothetical protein A2242_03355 [Candidatus Falkowbacteria bacterium RIFOXYA2_FULL_47_9]